LKRSLNIVVVSLLLTIAAHGQTRFVHTSGKELVAPDGSKLIIRGTNLGNWLVPEGYMFHFDKGPQSPREIESLITELAGPEEAENFWHEFRENYVTQDDIKFLKSLGMNTIRIPFHHKFFAAGNDEGFRLVDRVVAWSKTAGMYVILDMHCAPGGQTGTNIDDSWGYPWLFESPKAQEETIAIWKRIAEHYKSEPAVIGYDLLNEPVPHFPELAKYNPALELLYKRMVATVRQVDKNHTIFLGGAQWDSNFKVFGPPFDSNLAYTFHKYWMPPVEASIREYLDFRAKHNVPIYIGETGENKDEWVAEFRQLLEAHNIGWNFWPYKKMESTAGFVRFAKPVHWDRIVAYGKLDDRTGSDGVKARLAIRPTQAEIEECFADLLKQIEFAHCVPNRGYIEALGLKAP